MKKIMVIIMFLCFSPVVPRSNKPGYSTRQNQKKKTLSRYSAPQNNRSTLLSFAPAPVITPKRNNYTALDERDIATILNNLSPEEIEELFAMQIREERRNNLAIPSSDTPPVLPRKPTSPAVKKEPSTPYLRAYQQSEIKEVREKVRGYHMAQDCFFASFCYLMYLKLRNKNMTPSAALQVMDTRMKESSLFQHFVSIRGQPDILSNMKLTGLYEGSEEKTALAERIIATTYVVSRKNSNEFNHLVAAIRKDISSPCVMLCTERKAGNVTSAQEEFHDVRTAQGTTREQRRDFSQLGDGGGHFYAYIPSPEGGIVINVTAGGMVYPLNDFFNEIGYAPRDPSRLGEKPFLCVSLIPSWKKRDIAHILSIKNYVEQ